MHSAYLNKLTSEEYNDLKKKLHQIQGGKCYICGQDIDCDLQQTNIDHIVPLNGNPRGEDAETNFALTHEHCNKSKSDANLNVARALLKLECLQKKVEKEEGRAASLKDVLAENGGSLYDFSYKISGNNLEYSFDKTGDITIYRAPIFEDKLSGEKTCFVSIPLAYLHHDELINPRGINSSISMLVKEFYKKNPQLHLTLARIDNGKVRVFDGQHKAVAQILLGCDEILVRLFINPDVNKLTETNANAGSKLRQIAFDKAIMRQLNNTQYLEKVKQYRVEHSLKEDDFSFSELQLCDYFKGERMKTYIVEGIKSAITTSPDNKMKDYIDFEGKGKTLPLSHSTYDKIFLAKFIDSKFILSTPMDYKTEDGRNPRELEISQICRLLTMLTDVLYVGKFNQEIGVNRIEQRIVDKRDADITDDHLISYRISKEEIMYAWTPYLLKVIEMYLLNTGANYDKGCLFQTRFDDQLWRNLENFVTRFAALPLWKDRTMASTHFSGKKPTEFWVKVFETGKTPEGVSVLAERVNYMEMIK